MSHPLRNRVAIDVDDQVGIGNLGGVRVEGRPIMVAFFEPPGLGGDSPRQNLKKDIDTWRSASFAVNGERRAAGLRFVPAGWGWTNRSASGAAKAFSDAITALESDGVRRIDVVEWDVETHDFAWQVEFLLGARVEDDSGSWTKGIRGAGGGRPDPRFPNTLGYRWGRPGIWTMEGRQGADSRPGVGGNAAHLAARTGLWVGPQIYGGNMQPPNWSWHYEIKTWVLGNNPEKTCPPPDMLVPMSQFVPYSDARRSNRPEGESETVLFASSRLTELTGS